jgi:6-phosphogluconolactonase
MLSWLNQQPTLGGAPCFVSLDHSGSCLLVANYFGGNINLFPLQANGEIAEMAENIQRSGKGVGINPARQDVPHPHSIQVDPGGQPYAFVPDLGLDTLFVYRVDAHAHRLTPYREIKTEPGAGPRHLAFHPTGKYFYVINELSSTITAFAYVAEQANLSPLQTVSTLPADFQGENTSADIHISASGEYLYGSNRGHDSIVVFRIQPDTGRLTFVQHVSTEGKTPRNFALAPDGRYLLAANQDSHSIITYAVDQETGRLTPTGNNLEVSSPVCLQFMVRA